MAKTIIIRSHGVTTVEGTIIHCMASFADAAEFVFKATYDDRGVLAVFHDGNHLHNRSAQQTDERLG